MPLETLKQRIAREIGTPALVVDLDVVDRNIRKTQKLCDDHGIANRPHIKTHKSIALARLQREAGAAGIACQKLGEAEVMAEAGFENILIPYNLLGEEKIARLARLMDKTRMSVTADNAVVVAALGEAAAQAGRDLAVLVECDTGMKRAGVETPGEAIALAQQIAATPGLIFDGLLLYPPDKGVAATNAFLAEAQAGLRAAGLEPRVISSGGTPNLLTLGALPGQTEHRAGTSIFNDRMMMAAGFASEAECALTIYTTVVSRAGAERGILDAGSKTLTSDTGGLDGFGHLIEHPKARIARLSEEHGMLDLSACNDRPAIGDVVRVIPNHVCPVVNVVGRLVLVRDGAIVETLDVEARGLLT